MLLRIAIVDDLPQDAERLQQALTAEGQTNIIRYESGDALLILFPIKNAPNPLPTSNTDDCIF